MRLSVCECYSKGSCLNVDILVFKQLGKFEAGWVLCLINPYRLFNDIYI